MDQEGEGYLFPDQDDGLGDRCGVLPFGGGGLDRDLGQLQDGDGVRGLTFLTFHDLGDPSGEMVWNRGRSGAFSDILDIPLHSRA